MGNRFGYICLGQGVLDAYAKHNLRYWQLSPLSMFEESNTKTICQPKLISCKKAKLFIYGQKGPPIKVFFHAPILLKTRLMAFLDEKFAP